MCTVMEEKVQKEDYVRKEIDVVEKRAREKRRE